MLFLKWVSRDEEEGSDVRVGGCNGLVVVIELGCAEGGEDECCVRVCLLFFVG